MNHHDSPARTSDWFPIGHDAGIRLAGRWPPDGRLQLMRTADFDAGAARVIEVPPGLEEALAHWLLVVTTESRIRVDLPAGRVMVKAEDLERLTRAARGVTADFAQDHPLIRELDAASEPFSDTLPMAVEAVSD